MTERKLKQLSKRLRSLREEIGVIDEQLVHLRDDAEDAGIRALVAETSGLNPEARAASGSVEAMVAHRAHVIREIADLERRQDELLDSMTR